MDNQHRITNLVIESISMLGTVCIYSGGINISKESIYAKPIVISTVALSFVSPSLFRMGCKYVIKKINQKKKKK